LDNQQRRFLRDQLSLGKTTQIVNRRVFLIPDQSFRLAPFFNLLKRTDADLAHRSFFHDVSILHCTTRNQILFSPPENRRLKISGWQFRGFVQPRRNPDTDNLLQRLGWALNCHPEILSLRILRWTDKILVTRCAVQN